MPPHSVSKSIFLHLAPGVANLSATLLGFYALWNPSLPPQLIYGIFTNLVTLIPLQLGYLFYQAHKQGNPRFSLKGVVVLTHPLGGAWRLLGWTLAILIPTAIVFTTALPLTEALMAYSPINLDTQFQVAGGNAGQVPELEILLAINIVLTAFLVPITEELYFRGYLLPRMPEKFGKGKPLIHSFLFAVYHFDTPWLIPVRTVGLLPLIYVTLFSKSVTPGIIAHCLVNLANFVESISNRVRS